MNIVFISTFFISTIAFGLKSLLLLSVCLLLVSCGVFSRHAVDTYTLDDLNVNSGDERIYLKPFNAHIYPPQPVNGLNRQDGYGVVEHLEQNPFYEFRLKNGFRVFILPRKDIPSVSISAVVEAGKNHSTSHDELVSPLVLKLLKQGTEKYSKSEFQTQSSRLGNVMQYRQTPNFSVISVDILPQDLALALTLFAQQLFHIKPQNDAGKKIIEQQLLENRLAQSSGFYWAKLLFYQSNYPVNHPYYSQEPDSRQLKTISQQQLMDFYQKKYIPENTQLILVGDIDLEEGKALIQSQFEPWPMTALPPVPVSYETIEHYGPQSRIDLINRTGAQQANILYGVVTVAGHSADKTGLDMIAALLGAGPSSRLFVDLREKKGLAYSVSAKQIAGRYRSPFFIQISVAYDKVAQAIKGIKNHIDYLCRHPVDSRELQQIKQQLIGELNFQFQNNRQWLNDKVKQLENGLEEGYIAQQIRQINTMTAEQLLVLTNKYLCDHSQFIVVGEKSKLKKYFTGK